MGTERCNAYVRIAPDTRLARLRMVKQLLLGEVARGLEQILTKYGELGDGFN